MLESFNPMDSAPPNDRNLLWGVLPASLHEAIS